MTKTAKRKEKTESRKQKTATNERSEKQSTVNITVYDVEFVVNIENTKAFWKPLFTKIQNLI